MKKKLFPLLAIVLSSMAALLVTAPATGQQIYRCVSSAGVSEYINNVKEGTFVQADDGWQCDGGARQSGQCQWVERAHSATPAIVDGACHAAA